MTGHPRSPPTQNMCSTQISEQRVAGASGGVAHWSLRARFSFPLRASSLGCRFLSFPVATASSCAPRQFAPRQFRPGFSFYHSCDVKLADHFKSSIVHLTHQIRAPPVRAWFGLDHSSVRAHSVLTQASSRQAAPLVRTAEGTRPGAAHQSGGLDPLSLLARHALPHRRRHASAFRSAHT